MRKTGDTIPEERIARNLERVRARMAEAAANAGRDVNAITLIGVTKYSTNEETAALVRLGVMDLGESRVQDAELKIAALADPRLRWHLIGHLQTNKANKAARLFQTIHSIDSAHVVIELNKEAAKAAAIHGASDGMIEGYIEINAAREANKFGLPPEHDVLIEILKQCSELKSIRIVGVMGMAPYADDPEPASRPVFKRLRELRDEANAAKVYSHTMTELSMGMTQDFHIAIEEGATKVRVGSALFE